MNIPEVQIGFENGNLGVVATNPDGVCCIVASATNTLPFELNKAYTIYSLAEAEALGILPSMSNYELHKTIKEFYAEAGDGTELWIYGVAKTRTMEQLVSDSEAVLRASNRRIRFVLIKYAPETEQTGITAGLLTGFSNVVVAAQTIADDFTINKIHPVVFVIEAYNYTGVAQDLVAFETIGNFNRVAVLIGDTEKRTGATASKGAAVGVLGGRLAKNQVHVNVGRVKDGALKPLEFFIVDTPAEQVNIQALYTKGFITIRTHVGKSGYYFVDDQLSCTVEDDYHYITRRRVIDKAYVLANATLTNFILDDVPLTNEGRIMPYYATAIATEVERVIAQEMTAKGELSADITQSGDTGVQVLIDLEERIAVSSIIKGKIRVRPHGYGRYLEFGIGFNINE